MAERMRSSELLSRRDFVRLSGGASLGLLLASCGVSPTPTALPTASPTVTPSATMAPTATLTVGPTATITPTATPTPTPSATELPPPAATPGLQPARTLGEAGDRLGFQIGTTYFSDDILPGQSRAYIARGNQHFGAIWATSEFKQQHLDQWGDEGLRNVIETARGRHLFAANIFYGISGQIPEEIENSSDPTVVEANQRERLRLIFSYLQDRKAPTHMILNIEAQDIFEGKEVWSDDAYHRAYGDDIYVACGAIAFEEAIKAGLIPGKDIDFYVTNPGMTKPGAMLDFGLREYARARKALAQQFSVQIGASQDTFPYGLAVEAHATQSGTVRGHDPRPTLAQMTEAFSAMAKEGPLWIDTASLVNASGPQVVSYYTDIVTAGLSAGAQGMICWFGLRDCTAKPDPGWCNAAGDLFDSNGVPTPVYETFLTNLNSMIAENQRLCLYS